jgi:transcriptional regulator with XRE-family HTH domain
MSSKVAEKMSFTPAQCRAARALLDWSQSDLASASKVATKTIVNFERQDRNPYARTLDDIRAALEAAGVEFTNGERPGVRLKKRSEDGSTVERTFKIGDVVKQRDDLPPADIRRIDMTGRIVEQPTLPPSPTHVWVEFADGTVVALDKGRLIHANKR